MGILLQCDAVLHAPLHDRGDVAWADLTQCERVSRAWYALAERVAPQAAGALAMTLLALADTDDSLQITDAEVCGCCLISCFFVFCICAVAYCFLLLPVVSGAFC